jgi:hypothetical protein
MTLLPQHNGFVIINNAVATAQRQGWFGKVRTFKD